MTTLVIVAHPDVETIGAGARFPLARERFRRARRYDFTKPPHDGPLWYEILGWPMSGAEWRRLACR